MRLAHSTHNNGELRSGDRDLHRTGCIHARSPQRGYTVPKRVVPAQGADSGTSWTSLGVSLRGMHLHHYLLDNQQGHQVRDLHGLHSLSGFHGSGTSLPRISSPAPLLGQDTGVQRSARYDGKVEWEKDCLGRGRSGWLDRATSLAHLE